MTVNDVYELIKYIANKNQQGYISPSQFNLIINQAQTSYVSWLLGSFQQYQAGRPIAKVELGQNSVVRQRLSPAIYNYILNLDNNGRSPYPSDYIQTDAMWTIYGLKRIRYTEQDALYSVFNSVIDPVNNTNPVYLIENDAFQFYPTNLIYGQAKMSYVRNPNPIVWGYTLDGNNRPVYNSATSSDPIWDDTSMLDIIVRALKMVGVNLQSGAVLQYASEVQNMGQ